MIQDQYTKTIIFYTLAIKNLKMELRKNFIYYSIQKNEIGTNLTKLVQNLYSEKYKTSLKKN